MFKLMAKKIFLTLCFGLVLKFRTLFSFWSQLHKMLLRIANREDPDQTDSSEAVRAGSALFV